MFLTALLQGPLALLLEGRACDGPRARAWAYKAATIITPFGVAMGLHFASVATSITSTSFLHSMAYVNLSPLFFCALVLLRCAVSRAAWRGVSAPAPAPAPFFHPTRSPAPHVLEMLGAVLAFSGVVALAALDGGAATGAGDLPVTAAGDAAGIFASLFRRSTLWAPRAAGTEAAELDVPAALCCGGCNGAARNGGRRDAG
jgi:hypothetical protein